MIIHDVEQRSAAWHALRVGRLCASRASDMLAMIKSGEAAARRDLRLQLVVERLTGQPQEDGFVSGAMLRGVEYEATARTAYEALTGRLVQTVGFITHADLLAGASPDGQMEDFRRLVEIKVPKSSTHLGYLRAGKVPSAYLPQLTHQLWITGAEAVDFFSWDDRFPLALQSCLVTVTRADVDLKAYELAVRLFLSEVERECADVQRMVEAAA